MIPTFAPGAASRLLQFSLRVQFQCGLHYRNKVAESSSFFAGCLGAVNPRLNRIFEDYSSTSSRADAAGQEEQTF